jgi:hypothetical protein
MKLQIDSGTRALIPHEAGRRLSEKIVLQQ